MPGLIGQRTWNLLNIMKARPTEMKASTTSKYCSLGLPTLLPISRPAIAKPVVHPATALTTDPVCNVNESGYKAFRERIKLLTLAKPIIPPTMRSAEYAYVSAGCTIVIVEKSARFLQSTSSYLNSGLVSQ